MARHPFPASNSTPAPAAGGQPLSERVDAAGIRQHRDPAAARARRDAARQEEADARGWWWNHGDGGDDAWTWHGEGDLPDTLAPGAQ